MIPSGVPPPCRNSRFEKPGYGLGYYLYMTVPFFRVRTISPVCSPSLKLLSIGGPEDCELTKPDVEICESKYKIKDTMRCRAMQ